MNNNKYYPSDLSNGEQDQSTPEATRFLYRSLDEQLAIQNFLWNLLVDNCIKLQLSSASIKAGVTSLLDHTIFWAHSTQYDFLISIDESINDVTDLTMLMMLAFRIQAHRLELKIEPQDLNDILSKLRDQRPAVANGLELEIQFPSNEAAVTIDYGFILIALKLIIQAEVDLHQPQRKISMATSAGKKFWFIDIEGIQHESLEFLQKLSTHTPSFTEYEHHRADKLIRLILASWICQLQQVELIVFESKPGFLNRLRLAIPAA